MTGAASMAVAISSVGADCPAVTHAPTDAIRKFSQKLVICILT